MDTFQTRLRECLGTDTVSAFARRCDLPEATLRSYLEGRKPVFDKLIRIADAAGVTVDWLATGRPPRRSQPQNVQPNQPSSASIEALAEPHARRWAKIIELVEGFDNEAARTAFLDEVFARAQSTAELAELRRAVAQLSATLQKSA